MANEQGEYTGRQVGQEGASQSSVQSSNDVSATGHDNVIFSTGPGEFRGRGKGGRGEMDREGETSLGLVPITGRPLW